MTLTPTRPLRLSRSNMTRNATTHPKGTGAGWGGPKKAEGNQKAGPGRPVGVADG